MNNIKKLLQFNSKMAGKRTQVLDVSVSLVWPLLQ